MSHDTASDATEKDTPSLGVVQEGPTQFDEPFYRYLTTDTRLQLKVYYYGRNSADTGKDPEIGRHVGWEPSVHRGYEAIFTPKVSPARFARMVARMDHDLVILSGYNKSHTFFSALIAKLTGVPIGLRSDNVLPKAGGRSRYW